MRILLSLLLLTFISSTALAKEKILDIQKIKSANGIEAWLVEDHSLPIISIKFAFKGAGTVNLSENQQGLSQLLSNTMDEGAGEYTSQEFQKLLSDNSNKPT